jgi:hypothetical protein
MLLLYAMQTSMLFNGVMVIRVCFMVFTNNVLGVFQMYDVRSSFSDTPVMKMERAATSK